MDETLRIGIDIGSKTVKATVLDENNAVLHSVYRRHLTNITETLHDVLSSVRVFFPTEHLYAAVTGSAGIQVAEWLDLPFVQEVIATKHAVKTFRPSADVAIELGGEDSKILFLTGGEELRMNAMCAGGTGGFIDTLGSMLGAKGDGLSRLALGYQTIYPIASRCAVFAKSDIRPLMNEGASKRDIAASVLYAVAQQVKSGLACGRPIKGNVILLGGPFHFVSALSFFFARELKLSGDHIICPMDAHLYVAMGAALCAPRRNPVTMDELIDRLDRRSGVPTDDLERLLPLFDSSEQYEDFRKRHAQTTLKHSSLSRYEGDAYLGIDSGSTTLKCVLISKGGDILYTYYKRTKGEVVEFAKKMFEELYSNIPRDYYGNPIVTIRHATVTGYGEELLKNAFRIDSGVVETVAHARGARELDPDVDFLLDIGGQDIKCMRLKDGIITDVSLNEACSSGCGALIGGFAHSMRYSSEQFAKIALEARRPVDLGTRCTVFMTSRVRHAQKVGASAGDISAGLAYSVIKNALYKVIRVRDAGNLGEHIVVSGGTFMSDAVLRAFELLCGREVKRCNADSHVLGAYGAALIARSRDTGGEKASTLLSREQAAALTPKHNTRRCGGCANNCLLTINDFGLDDEGKPRRFILGNRCERGAGKQTSEMTAENGFAYQYRRVFDYDPSPEAGCITLPGGENVIMGPYRGMIGVPRALLMYEQYPFWFTLLSQLGFTVKLSDASDRHLFLQGLEHIPSESICYPAKMAHGHVANLLRQDVNLLFMPSFRSVDKPTSQLSCPMVASYATILAHDVAAFGGGTARLVSSRIEGLDDPELPFKLSESFSAVWDVAFDALAGPPTTSEIESALAQAHAEQNRYENDIRRFSERALEHMRKTGGRGIVLGGRPYHVDPEFNHGIPELLCGYGYTVLTAQSTAHLAGSYPELYLDDRWKTVSPLYAAAAFAASEEDLSFIELYSFGCGIDAVTTDQTRAIVEARGDITTALKIDEMDDLGVARIRIRSLFAALEERGRTSEPVGLDASAVDKPAHADLTTAVRVSDPKAKLPRIVSCPDIPSCYLSYLRAACDEANIKLLSTSGEDDVIARALSLANNDLCYPMLLSLGRTIQTSEDPHFPSDATLLLPATCANCREVDTVALTKRLTGQANRPVRDVRNLLDELRALKPDDVDGDPLWRAVAEAFVRGDAARPRATDASAMPIGIVGTGPAVFSPIINNGLAHLLESEGCTPCLPRLTDYLLFDLGREHPFSQAICAARDRLGYTETSFSEMQALADGIIPRDVVEGAGWMLPAMMADFLEHGVSGLVYVHPFGCLPGHISGRGCIDAIKRRYPHADIIPIDYDPAASGVNQLNRVRLLLGIAFERRDEHAAQDDASLMEASCATCR